MTGPKTVVIARPPEDSREIAEAIASRGYTPLVEPVLSIEILPGDPPVISPEAPLVFTSANGVRAFAEKSIRRIHPVYVVGGNTADAARQAGFSRIEVASGTVDDLVNILLKNCEKSRISPLYIRGEDVSKDITAILAEKSLVLSEFIGYRSVSAEKLSLSYLKTLDARDVAAILFFSAKGGRAFAELTEQYDRVSRMRTTKALCISEAVLQSVSVLPFGETLVAAKPDRYGMIELLDRLPALN